MKYTDFSHDQWYRLWLTDKAEPMIFQAYRWDEFSGEEKPKRPRAIEGRYFSIDEAGVFAIDDHKLPLKFIVRAEPISPLDLVMHVLGFIVDDHNQWVEDNGLTCTGQPPMVLRVKPNGWICLEAASFYGRHMTWFGILLELVPGANYELLQSEVLVKADGGHGVCLEIEMWGGR